MLSLNKLRHLVLLVEEESFTRAAERLRMSQPSLSRSIAQLERACGVRLLDRGRSGVSLTPAGADLVADARQILGQVGSIEQNFMLQSRGEAGRVTLGMGPLASSYLMARLLSECVRKWPAMAITASTGTTRALIEQVLDGRLDFCVCSANNLDLELGLEIKRLGVLSMGYFVRADHPLTHARAPLNWDDLAPFPRGSGTNQRLEPSFQRTFGPLSVTVECDDYEVFRRILPHTDTIWLSSRRVLEQELTEGSVREIDPDQNRSPTAADLVLVQPARRSQSPAMLNVIATITDVIFASTD